MKSLFALAFTAALTITAGFAQQRSGYGCGTDENAARLAKEFPQENAQRAALEKQVQALVESGAAQRMSQTTLVIPVVVHVMSTNGAGISKAQVEDGIAVLNRDYRRRNADTINTRPLFAGFAADFNIEFRLAKLDPNGNCTEGIVRVATPLTNAANDQIKSLSYWPSDQYLNIWLVNFISLGGLPPGFVVGGYAQFPGSGSPSTYGFVNRHDNWGTIGTAAGTDGRVPTHEIGHCLDLYHTFQGGCGSSCNNSGDFVCDTPPAAQATYNQNCNNNTNQCANDTQGPSPYTSNVPDQTENYMSYDGCQNMFTQGQKNRVVAAFATYSFLQNLTSQANAIATGTNDGFVAVPCAPVALFTTGLEELCANSSVTFYDASYNTVMDSTITRNWSFPGGTPSSSTAVNPTVTYNTPGTYNATLVISNSAGVDSITRTAVVKVLPITGGKVGPFSEDFESTSFPSSGQGLAHDWTIDNNGGSGWHRTTNAAFQSTASMRINNLTLSTGTRKGLITPTIDVSNMSSVKVEFDLSYALRNANNVDRLYIYTSTNCGQTWQLRYTKTGTQLGTNNGVNQPNFTPTNASQWRHETVNLAGVAGQANLRVKLEVESDAGNNLYIDNFQLSGTVLSAAETLNGQPVAVFPNPVTSEATLSFFLPSASKASVQVQDVVGRTLASKIHSGLSAGEQQLSISELVQHLPAGLYLLQLTQNDQTATVRFVKN